jgi:FG-GAP-like repeat/IPT/TIG domain
MLCVCAALLFPFLIIAQPVINSFSPSTGSVGSTVVISGSNFSSTTSGNIVYFGAVRAAVTAASTTALAVTVPAGASFGPMTVEVGGLTAYDYNPFIATFSDPGQFLASAFASKVAVPAGQGPSSIAAADFDGDGRPDVVIADGDSTNIEVFLNKSTPGVFSFAQQYYFSLPNSDVPAAVAVGDLDGDGKPDIVVSTGLSPRLYVFLNTSTAGAISFASPLVLPQGSYCLAVTVGDCNGDGKPEIVVVNVADGNISVYGNNSTIGNLSFAARMQLTPATNDVAYAAVIADIDGDGMPDIATADAGKNKVTVFHNTGSPGGALSFAPYVDFGVGTTPESIAVGDLDGDGMPDLVTGDFNGNTVSYLHNTSTAGSISFAASVQTTAGSNPQSVTISDLDGDGKPDVETVNFGDNDVSVFKNTSTSGNIALAAQVTYGTDVGPSSMAAVDMDGDGFPDISIAASNAILPSDPGVNAFDVLHNQGSASASITSFTPTNGPAGTVVTITGTNLTGATSVTFGDSAATNFTVVSATTIRATVGNGATGNVTVVTPAGTASLGTFTYGLVPPNITGFSPTSATTQARITITGTSLSTVTNITIGGVVADFSIISDSVIWAYVEGGATGYIAATSPGGTDSVPGFTYVVPQPLTFTSFTPSTGTTGTNILIKGEGLSANPTVSFGGVAASNISVQSDTVIIATVGSGASGAVSVTVGGETLSLPGFTYTAPTSPNQGTIQVTAFTPSVAQTGASVTITGENFTGATGVSFGGVPALTFSVNTDSQIVAVVGNGATGVVTVASPTSSGSLSGFTFDAADSTSTPAGFQLLQFVGALVNNKPLLQWTTINDAGVAYYAVERSIDSLQFTDIGTVASDSTGNINYTYNFTDSAPRDGINYYRLKIQDTTAAFSYSATVAVQPLSTTMPVYPNPVKYGFFLVDLPDISKTSQFRLSDLNGRVIQTLSVPAGVAQQRINVPGLIPGTYSLLWTNGIRTVCDIVLILPE